MKKSAKAKTRPPARELTGEQSRTDAGGGWVAPLIVAGAGMIVYLNSFAGVFLFDDRRLLQDERLQHLWPPWPILTGSRRPIVDLTMAVNHAIGEWNIAGYHAVNLLIHVLSGVLLYGIIRRTLACEPLRERFGSVARGLALAASLLWIVHPLQTESVTYIIQRAESLMGLFYLLTLYCVIRGAASSRGTPWYVASIAACALGMGSKGVMITAPLMVLMYDSVFLGGSLRNALRKRFGLYAVLAGTPAVLVFVGVVRGVLFPGVVKRATVGFGFEGISIFDYAMTQPGVILQYLKLSIWPFPQCLDWVWPVAEGVGIVVPGVIVVGLIAATVWALWRRPALGFIGVWFFLILAPTSSVIPIKDPLFEHRMYLPLAAPLLLLVLGGFAGMQRIRRRHGVVTGAMRAAAAGAVLMSTILFGTATILRNRDYHSTEAMWRDVVVHRPTNVRAYVNLGNALLDGGRASDSISVFQQGIEVDEKDASLWINLGRAFDRLGRKKEAIAAYQTSISADPKEAAAHYNLGNLLMGEGRRDEGIAAFRDALRVNPRFFAAQYNLGVALTRAGQVEEAVQVLQTAIKLRPKDMKARSALGDAYRRLGNSDSEENAYSEALKLHPKDAALYEKLGSNLSQQGKHEEAITAYQRAIQLDPQRAGAHLNLAIVLADTGAWERAVAAYRASLNIAPDDAKASLGLGVALLRLGRSDDAITTLQPVCDETVKEAFSAVRADACFNLALALGRRGKPDRAIAACERALSFNPNHADAKRALRAARTMQESGNSDKRP